jgi:hypothetical protein
VLLKIGLLFYIKKIVMAIYHTLKKLLTSKVLDYQKRFTAFNLTMNARKEIKRVIRNSDIPKLTPNEIKEAKSFFKSKGYKLKNTYWHRFFKSATGEFHKDYIPLDIFRPLIEPNLNRRIYWPALLDKNLTSNLFKEFNQPQTVINNINGFYYINGEIVSESIAIEECNKTKTAFIIKPTVDSGKGKMVKKFTADNGKTSIDNLKTIDLFKLYKKDFIVQKVVKQSAMLKTLNPSTLNTLRVVSYLNKDGVVCILTVYLRIGKPGSDTDNISIGGIACAVKDDGFLNKNGYTNKKGGGKITMTKTPSGILLENYQIPNYSSIIKMVKEMHPIVPVFKIISWDIGVDYNDMPILIEYNTFYQNVNMQQFTGPLFGEYANEILTLGLEPK